VATEETLGHLADWLGVNPAVVREFNHMDARATLHVGQRVKLDFRNATHEVFEARRREYHRSMQASYFASHRIVGTQVYIARAGDSLWTLTQRVGQVPQWLLQQYNPNLDFSNLRPGSQVVVPRVEEVSGAAGG
jgi:membrane-bound lytic murein transglycosylase D